MFPWNLGLFLCNMRYRFSASQENEVCIPAQNIPGTSLRNITVRTFLSDFKASTAFDIYRENEEGE